MNGEEYTDIEIATEEEMVEKEFFWEEGMDIDDGKNIYYGYTRG